MSRRRRSAIFCLLVFVLCVVLLPSIQKQRGDNDAPNRSAWNLRLVGTGFRSYSSGWNRFPPVHENEHNGLSWRVWLLPYLEQVKLYDKFDQLEPWDSPTNLPLLTEQPPNDFCFYWGSRKPIQKHETFFQVFTGRDTVFERKQASFNDITDGVSNTLLAAEAANPVPWSKPADIEYDPDKPIPPLGGWYARQTWHFGFRDSPAFRRPRIPGFNVLFADGSVRFLRQDTDDKILRALITRNGGEKVSVEEVQ